MGHSVVSAAHAAADGLFSLLFPSDCRLCGAPLVNISRLPVCSECLASIAPRQGVTCATCGERLAGQFARNQQTNEPICGECLSHQPEFVKASAYAAYDGGLRELIHLLKYDRVRPAANVLGRMLADAIADLEPGFGDAAPLVVPVPLHASKLRARGFNQSELIARAAVKCLPGGRELPLNPAVLIRHRDTESQTGLSRSQRQANLRGAFRVKLPVQDRDILLLDDVFTTGATVSECARTLRRAGATRVWVATVARVLQPEAVFAASPQEKEDSQPQALAAHG